MLSKPSHAGWQSIGIPTLSQIQAERARRAAEIQYGNAADAAIDHLAEFVRQAWPITEPSTPLVWNWHLDLQCEALERQARGDPGYRKILFSVPPGTMKSLQVSVFEPAWEWLHDPGRRKLFLSNDDALCVRDSRRTRDIITSEWYRGLVARAESRQGRRPWYLAFDQNEKVNFANDRQGFRQCRSIFSKLTGKRADDIVIDDPVDAKEVVNGSMDQVASRLNVVNNVIEKVLPSRVNNLATARWTLIMQRLHDDDPAGHAIAQGDWRVISIQMEFEPDNSLNHPNDPRKTSGELMFPALFPAVELAKLKILLGLRHWSSQYQQRPLPGEGGPLKRWYWCFWYPADVHKVPPPVLAKMPDGSQHECPQKALPSDVGGHTQSWDMAFKDTRDSAFVVGQVWADKYPDCYLLDQSRDKMDIVATLDAVKALSLRWPQAFAKLIEDKANGPAVIGLLQTKLPGLTEVNPLGGKEARANAAAPLCRGGNVWLPHPALFPWVNAFIDELEAFPAGRYADQVDAMTQYLLSHYGDMANTTRMLAKW